MKVQIAYTDKEAPAASMIVELIRRLFPVGTRIANKAGERYLHFYITTSKQF